MRNKLFIILFIIILGAIASYLLAGSILIYLLTLLIGGSILYFTKINNKDRKENLNIIRDENKLYFYLSDDLLFSVDLLRNKSITETLRTSIKEEIYSENNKWLSPEGIKVKAKYNANDLKGVDESTPYPKDFVAPYGKSKAMAEKQPCQYFLCLVSFTSVTRRG